MYKQGKENQQVYFYVILMPKIVVVKIQETVS